MRKVDFVLAYPQADITHDNYMKFPKGVKKIYGNGKTNVLKIKKNLYSGKNAGKIWFNHLKGALGNISFEQLQADNCVFYRKGVVFMFYVNEILFFARRDKYIDKGIKNLQNVSKAQN